MSTKTTTGLTEILAGNLDDTAVFWMDDKNAATRKASVAQVWTQLAGSNRTFAKTLTVTERVLVDSVTDATSGTDGSLQTDGGLSVVKAAWIGTTLTVGGTTTAAAVNASGKLTVTTTAGNQADIGYDAGKYLRFNVTSAGNVQVSVSTGGQSFQLVAGSLVVGSTGATATGLGELEVQAGLYLTGAAPAGSGATVILGGTTQTTIGANGAASALTANPLGYLIAYKGATKIVIPYYNA